MFTFAIRTILNGYTQVNIKILLIRSYHTTCVSFSCEFTFGRENTDIHLSLITAAHVHVNIFV